MNSSFFSTELSTDQLILKPIQSFDRDFINLLFQDNEIQKYYIVPKESHQDYRKLVDYWQNDLKNGAGTCWIIYEKGGFFSKNKQCGFVAFEFRYSLKNARISYAIHPLFREKRIATNAIKLIIDLLKRNGIQSVETDIDRNNLISEKIVDRLGFTTDKTTALFDSEMMIDGKVRFRFLWVKLLI